MAHNKNALIFLSSIISVTNTIKEAIENETITIDNEQFNEIIKIDDILDTLHYNLLEGD
jgi:ribonuclease HIII